MHTPQTAVIAFLSGKEIFHAVLPPGEYVMGRKPGVEIVLDSENVSRRHARLMLNYHDWLIEDLGSSNGTRVGGARIREATLVFPSQRVQVGIYALGAILYQMVTLEPSARGKDPLEILENVVQGRITPVLEALAGRALPHLAGAPSLERLAAVTMKALSNEPAHRQSSVKALQAELRAGLR